MNKTETIEAALQGDGCLGRSADDEPVFVLCARDRFAPGLVRKWADRVEAVANEHGEGTERTRQKIASARELADEMEAWQAAHVAIDGLMPGTRPGKV